MCTCVCTCVSEFVQGKKRKGQEKVMWIVLTSEIILMSVPYVICT